MYAQLEFNIDNQILTRTDSFKPVRCSKNYLYAKFNFQSDEWEDKEKFAVFTGLGVDPLNVRLDDENICLVPYEASGLSRFYVSVFAGDLITSNAIQVDLINTNYQKGEVPEEPTPSIYAQIVSDCEKAVEESEQAKQTAQLVKNDADEGKFTPVKGVDYYTDEDISNMISSVEESIRPTLEEIKEIAETAETVAKGRATGYVFDTVDDMNTWLEDTNNISVLNQGDNLYIRDLDVPDYWWDGEQVQYLETQKVDLTEYVKNTDYATANSAGVVKSGSNGFSVSATGNTVCSVRTLQQYSSTGNSYFISKGTLENIKSNYVKEGLGIENSLKDEIMSSINAYVNASCINWKTFFAARATGEVYSTKFPTYETNTTSDGEKLNASAGLVAVPSTETEAGRDDFASRNAFRYIDCNFICTDDGVKVPTVLACQGGYTNTGKVDVGILTPPTYWAIERHYDDGYYVVHFSDTKHEELDMVPTPWCVDPAGNEMGYGIVTKYYAGYIDDILYSSSGVINPGFMSYQYAHNELQKKGSGYFGSGSERTAYLLCMLWIKCATKNSQNIFRGCTSYNHQYYAVEETTDQNYITIATNSANNLVVGSCVTVGEIGSNTNIDRGQTYTHNIKTRCRITKIEAVRGTTNSRVYLEGDAFSCTTTSLLSTITCISGETDNILGADGYVANDGKHAFKLGGIEEGVGAYYISLNEISNKETSTTVSKYVRGNATWSTSVTNYTKVATYDLGTTNGQYIGDIEIDLATGVYHSRVYGTGASVGCGDYEYKGDTGTGLREALERGALWSGSSSGLVLSHLGCILSYQDWSCAVVV